MDEIDKCLPSPCGPNAQCIDGTCTCLVEYQGDPYIGCRPECILSSDCSKDKACIRQKCSDSCPGTCGQNAECAVINHIPMCACISGYTGDAFVLCKLIPRKTIKVVNIQIYRYYFYSCSQAKSLQPITLRTEQSV